MIYVIVKQSLFINSGIAETNWMMMFSMHTSHFDDTIIYLCLKVGLSL